MGFPLIKLAAFSLLVGSLSLSAPSVWVAREAYLMGTTLNVSVPAGSRADGFRAIDSVFAAVRRTEAILSDWRNDGELYQVNHFAPESTVRLSPALARYLAESERWTRATGGTFDPGIGAFNDAWDSRGAGRRPSERELSLARKRSGLLRFHLDTTKGTIRRPSQGSWIDAGGFGKGAALREAHQSLRVLGVPAGILNFGGQILVFGDTTLHVEIAHPVKRRVPAAGLQVRDASVSTTSQSERYIEVEGRRFGHVFDPRNGSPVAPWGSVTVVHPDPTVADILSTALFVMGPVDGMHWLERQNIAALFLVTSGLDLKARWTPQMTPYLDSLPSNAQGD